MEYIKTAQSSVDSVLRQKYVTEVLAGILVVFAVVANRAPAKLLKAVNSWITRGLIVVLLVLMGTRHPLLSILLVVVVVITYQVRARASGELSGVIMPPMTAGSPDTPATPQSTFLVSDSVVARQLAGTKREVLPDPVPGMGCPSCKTVDFLPKEEQTDKVPGADQTSCVQTYRDQYCVQGIERTGVQGFDDERQYSPF